MIPAIGPFLASGQPTPASGANVTAGFRPNGLDTAIAVKILSRIVQVIPDFLLMSDTVESRAGLPRKLDAPPLDVILKP
jgi:hypothetical protein